MVLSLLIKEDSAFFSLIAYAVSMAVPILFLSSSESSDVGNDFRLPKKPFSCAVFAVCVIYLGNLVSFALSNAFAAFGYGISADFPVYGDAPSVILSFIQLVILPPLLEEILMRKYVLGMLLPYGKSCAVLFSSFAFALFHMNLMQMPFALLCGVLFGYFTVKTGSITFAVLIHFLNNLSAFALSYLEIETAGAPFLLAGLFFIPLGITVGVNLYKNGYFKERPSFFKVSFSSAAYAAVCLLFAILAIKPL